MNIRNIVRGYSANRARDILQATRRAQVYRLTCGLRRGKGKPAALAKRSAQQLLHYRPGLLARIPWLIIAGCFGPPAGR